MSLPIAAQVCAFSQRLYNLTISVNAVANKKNKVTININLLSF